MLPELTGGTNDRIRTNELRGAVNRSFTAPAMHAFEPTVRRIVNEAFDEVLDRQEFEMVEGLAAKIASRVISALIGVPDADAGLMRQWTREQSTFNGASFWLTGPDDPRTTS